MPQTIEIESVTFSKNPCSTAEQIKIEVKAIFNDIFLPDVPMNLPFTLSHGLGEGEFD